ncbi:MFS family permease [Bradyrhizobium sp. i1.4.4]
MEGLDRTSLVTQLLVMAIALSIGALLLGVVADSLRRHGKNTGTLLAIIAAVFIAAELALILHPPFLSLTSWIIVAVVGSAIALSYTIIGDYFPAELIARANGALNVLHFGVGLPRPVWDGANSRAMAGKGRTLPFNRLSDRIQY